MKTSRAVLILFAGLLFTATALLAVPLGLDRSAGWGRFRIGLLILGALLSSGAVLYIRFAVGVDDALRSLRSLIDKHPLASRLRRSRGLISFGRVFRAYWLTIPTLALVLLVYAWFASSGTWTNWVSPTRYYADLARGFQRGQLYTPTQPEANLLALPNPYDPSTRVDVRAPIDISFYKGHFYLYWGPVPALVLLAIRPFVHGRVGDLQLVFAFVSGIFLFQYLLITAIWDRFFRKLPFWLFQISILVIGLAGPVNYLLGNFISGRIHEAAITGGQFFFVCGWLLIYCALNTSDSSWLLAAAGIAWAPAIGTRQILALPIAFLSLMLAYRLLVASRASIHHVLKLAALGLPLALGLAGLGWYNWARFGSPFESGLYYQLTGPYLQKYFDILFSPIYSLQNLYNYLLNPVSIHSQFPFLALNHGRTQAILPPSGLPWIYGTQLLAGIMYTAPFTVFAIIPFIRGFLNPDKKRATQAGITTAERRNLNWIIVSLGGAFLASFGVLMMYFWSATRFAVDFMPCLSMLGVIGFWQGYQACEDKPLPRKIYSLLGITLAVMSIMISTLLALSMNDARFLFVR